MKKWIVFNIKEGVRYIPLNHPIAFILEKKPKMCISVEFSDPQNNCQKLYIPPYVKNVMEEDYIDVVGQLIKLFEKWVNNEIKPFFYIDVNWSNLCFAEFKDDFNEFKKELNKKKLSKEKKNSTTI